MYNWLKLTFPSFSYECDEFVINDTECGALGKLRHRLSPASVTQDDEGSWKSDSVSKEMQENVRCLRPRSRKR
jgi:hypothetical protein